jgi:hypothetical protein
MIDRRGLLKSAACTRAIFSRLGSLGATPLF